MAAYRRDPRKDRSDAYLKKTNMDLVHVIDEMKIKRDEVQKDVKDLKDEQERLQSDILKMTSQLTKINEGLCQKISERDKIDAIIVDYESAFSRLIQGSESLLTSMRKAIQLVAPQLLQQQEETEVTVNTKRTKSSRQSHSVTPGQLPRDPSRVTPLTRNETRGPESRAETRADTRLDMRLDTRQDIRTTSQMKGDIDI